MGSSAARPFRYEVDFLPALVLLAVVGILGLERALADRPVWRRAARWGWGLLLGFSVAFNLLVGVENYAYAGCALGTVLAEEGRRAGSDPHLRESAPDQARLRRGARRSGERLAQAGRLPEAIAHYEQALRIKPDYAEAHNNLGIALAGWAGCRRRSSTTSRRCGSSPITPRRTTTWGMLCMRTGKRSGGDRALRAGAADQARLRRGAKRARTPARQPISRVRWSRPDDIPMRTVGRYDFFCPRILAIIASSENTPGPKIHTISAVRRN